MLLAAWVTAQPSTTTVRVAPRPRLDVVFDAPPSGIANASRSDMVRAVAKSALAFSDLQARPTSGVRLDPCFRDERPSPLLCLLLELRPAFEDARARAPVEDFEKLWTQSRSTTTPEADVALLVTYAPVLDRNRVLAVMLDLRAMARRYARWARSGPLSNQEKTALQEELFEVGVMTQPPIARDVVDAEDVELFMNDLFRTEFAGALRKSGLQDFGGLDVVAPKGASLFLDGRELGSVETDVLQVRDVPSGDHRLRLEHPKYLVFEALASTSARRVVVFEPQLIPAPGKNIVAARTALTWVGVAAMLAGAAITTTVLLQDEQMNRCFPEEFLGAHQGRDSRNSDLFSALPLGYSIFGAGATWTISSLLNTDDQQWPIWELVAGISVAAAAYGISALSNPPSQ